LLSRRQAKLMEKKGVAVRILIWKRDPNGKIDYRLNDQTIRLPLKRDDRCSLSERLKTT